MSIDSDDVVAALSRIEAAFARIYLLFSQILPEDEPFYRKLYQEEERHGMLIRSLGDYIAESPELAAVLLRQTAAKLHGVASGVEGCYVALQSGTPTRAEAVKLALGFEHEAGEAHLQQALNLDAQSVALKLFQMLATLDQDHAARIEIYAVEQGLTLDEAAG